MKTNWYVYLVLCCDNTLYCGIAKDVVKRVFEHNFTDKGAKYTRGRRHVLLVYTENHDTMSDALKREAQIKKMKRSQKDALRKDWDGKIHCD